MNFKDWLLTEEIFVKWQNNIAKLEPAKDGVLVDISCQWEEGFSSYYLGSFKATKEGYISIGDKPTHVGIIKNSPLIPNSGPDFGFIKNLIGLFQKNNLKPVAYKEIGSFLDPLLAQINKKTGQNLNLKPLDDKNTEFKTGEDLPDLAIGQTAHQPYTGGIKASKSTGSWAQFFETEYASYLIQKIIDYVKQAAKPLIENNLIELLEIDDRKSIPQIIYSKEGQEKFDNYKTSNENSVAQLKFMAEKTLGNFPNFKKELLSRINRSEKWFASSVKPENFRIPNSKLLDFVKDVYHEDPLIYSFIDSYADSNRLQQLENLCKHEKGTNAIYYLYEYFWKKESNIITRPDNILLYLNPIFAIVVNLKNIIKSVAKDDYENFANEVKNSLEEALSSGYSISKHDVDYLLAIGNSVGINSKLLSDLDQMDAHYKEQKKKREEEIKNRQKIIEHLFPVDTQKYLMINENKWKTIPYEFLDYNSEIDLGEFALEFIDDEALHMDAYEKAVEEAMDEVEPKPSDSYGDNKEEVDVDINYDLEDFYNLELADKFKDYENLSDKDLIEKIKEKHREDFINWKIEGLKEKEEQESWKYEPDVSSYDFQNRLGEIKKELAEKQIWDEGLVTASHLEYNNVEINLAKKNWEKFKKKLKETIEINIQEKDEENIKIWSYNTFIKIKFEPQGEMRKSVNEFLQIL